MNIRRKMIAFTLFLILYFMALIVGLRVLTKSSSPLPIIAIEDQYRPGMPRPEGAVCTIGEDHENKASVGCRAIQKDGSHIYYVLDSVYAGEITYASMLLTDRDISVGQLILQWGTPIGYSATNTGRTLYWADGRYVYCYVGVDQIFTPNTKAGFMAYSLREESGHRWQGFILHPTSTPLPPRQ